MLVFGKSKSRRYFMDFIDPLCKAVPNGLHALNPSLIPSDSAWGFYTLGK